MFGYVKFNILSNFIALSSLLTILSANGQVNSLKNNADYLRYDFQYIWRDRRIYISNVCFSEDPV